MKNKILKMFLFTIMIILMVICLTACDSKKDNKNNKENSNSNKDVAEIAENTVNSLYGEITDDLEKQVYNNKFSNYKGKHSGTDVVYFIESVLEKDIEKNKSVTIVFNNETKTSEKIDVSSSTFIQEIEVIKGKILAKHFYTIDIGYNDSTGLVNEVIINY